MDHPIRLVHFDVQISIGDLAKAATQWLLRSIRSTNSTLSSGTTDHGLHDGFDTYTNIDKNSNGRRNTKDRQRERNERIYCQKRDETINSNLTKGDDKILDCCLFFQRKGEVILWTEDKNLTLLAEANSISTLHLPRPSLLNLLSALNISFPTLEVLSTQHQTISQANIPDFPQVLIDDSDMELDYHPEPSPPSGRKLLNPFIDLSPIPDLPSRIPPHYQIKPSLRRSSTSTSSSSLTLSTSSVPDVEFLELLNNVFLPISHQLTRLVSQPFPGSSSSFSSELTTFSQIPPPTTATTKMTAIPTSTSPSTSTLFPTTLGTSTPILISSSSVRSGISTSLNASNGTNGFHRLRDPTSTSTSTTTSTTISSTSKTLTTPTKTLTTLRTTLEALTKLEKSLFPSLTPSSEIPRMTNQHQSLLRSIASIRTLIAFISPTSPTLRRPRTGEVIETIMPFCQFLDMLGVEYDPIIFEELRNKLRPSHGI
ncbi:hypothetical protein M231_07340 [Tremella mesenterica]|uniref:PIN domain-containing protein n=1 Tax=Tremella mesenterica TaxID=5217 RepID=A0A4Q1BC77_TREME|nr:hypothetical protein M231_07340 [Tremella mesenterica]